MLIIYCTLFQECNFNILYIITWTVDWRPKSGHLTTKQNQTREKREKMGSLTFKLVLAVFEK